jgi:dolichol-phosphate mannosyltransferase
LNNALILIPTYNEIENLANIVTAVLAETPSHVHVLVIDDNSPDGTGKAADQLAAEYPRVKVLHRAGKEGLGKAYLAGFDWGLQQGYGWLIEMDADFSHHPRYLPTMLKTLEDFEVAIGSRNIRGGGTVNWGIGRKIISRGGSLYARLILGAPIRDFTGGFNGWHRKVLEGIDLATIRSNGYAFQIELKYRAFKRGFKIREFPIIFEDRAVGKSKMSKRIVFEALKKVWGFRFSAMALLAMLGSTAWAQTPQVNVLIVDKKTNQLHVTRYQPDRYEILKTYHTTVGKVMGDKEDEGDLKTPEGVYHFTMLLRPPSLKPKFGVMAFYINYPNNYDRVAGRTGFDIMLHATNEPERLKQDFDSEGCVVLKNEELDAVKPYIRLGLTPILIFDDFAPPWQKPEGDEALKKFFSDWVAAWESRDIDRYIGFYHSAFVAQRKSLEEYKKYKKSLIDRYSKIQVGATNVLFLRHPKYSVVMFTQNYRSTLKSGGTGHVSRGTKTLYIAEDAGQMRILDEDFTQSNW